MVHDASSSGRATGTEMFIDPNPEAQAGVVTTRHNERTSVGDKKRPKAPWSKGIVSWTKGDTLYLSIPFTWLLPEAEKIANKWPAKVVAGGPAVKLMPPTWADETPDICDIDVLALHNPLATFTSRGCPNHCSFCAVGRLEPEFIELDQWRHAPVICDNNLVACSERHFKKVIDSLLPFDDSGLVDFNQGLEASRFTEFHGRELSRLKKKKVRFAFDRVEEEGAVRKAVELARRYGCRDFGVYVLLGYNDTPEDARYRLETIRSMGIWPNPMRFQPLDALQKNSYVGPAWTDEELKRMMRYYSRLRYFEDVPYDQFVNRASLRKGLVSDSTSSSNRKWKSTVSLTQSVRRRKNGTTSQIGKNGLKPGPLFAYIGSKWRMMPRLIPLFPNHTHYVSVYGGSAADILRKPRSRLETFNELDAHINALFTLLMDDGLRAKLVERLKHTPVRNRPVFLEAVNLLKNPDGDPINAAWAFLVASCQAAFHRHPLLLRPSDWAYLVNKIRPGRMLRLPAAVEFAARRFRRVQITNWDWRGALRKLDGPTTLFFMDPPYWPITEKAKYYAVQMTLQDHQEMLAAVQAVRGYVMLCGYANHLYDEALSSWRRVQFATNSTLLVSGRRTKRTETFWMNYLPDGTKVERNSK